MLESLSARIVKTTRADKKEHQEEQERSWYFGHDQGTAMVSWEVCLAPDEAELYSPR